MKRSTRWMGLAGLLAGVLWSGAVYAQDITAFQNGHITFENTDTNLYYRIEFRPSLTGPGEWLADLPDNIKSADAEVTVPVGVFYRVAGSYEPFSEGGGGGGGAGTATEADLRDGKTAWVDDVQLTGTMPERSGHVAAQSSSVQFSFLRFRPPAGYYPGTEDNSVQLSDSNFTAANIRTGVSIFGVAGSALLATGNASAGEVLAGRTFSSAAGASTGTMPERTGLVESQGRTLSGTTLGFRPQPGYYSGDVDNYVTFTDASFVAGNILSGANIFGLGGSVIEATGTAADSSVLAGQTFSRAGAANRTGTYVPPIGMVLIPGGTNAGTDPDYGAYSLTVDSFHMDRTPVTKVQWDEVYTWAVHSARGANVYSFDKAGSGKDGAHPVHTVNWYDVVKWCNARSEKEGRTPVYTVSGNVYRTGQSSPSQNTSANGYRLPTVTEHQYASRGGLSGRRFPWGDTITHSQANYYSDAAVSYDISTTRGYHPTYNDGTTPYTSPAGSFAANGYGLYDMAGNVWNWCWDPSGSYRAIRGGGWYGSAYDLRCGDSHWRTPVTAYNYSGFRAVCR